MALDPLGVEDGPAEYYEPDVDRNISMAERARMLQQTLEGFAGGPSAFCGWVVQRQDDCAMCFAF